MCFRLPLGVQADILWVSASKAMFRPTRFTLNLSERRYDPPRRPGFGENRVNAEPVD